MHSFPILNLSIGWAHPERWHFTTTEGKRKLTQLQRPNREYNSGLPCAVKITSQLSAMYSSNLHVYPTFNPTIFVYLTIKLTMPAGFTYRLDWRFLMFIECICWKRAQLTYLLCTLLFLLDKKCNVLVATRDKRLCNQRAHAIHVTRDLFF